MNCKKRTAELRNAANQIRRIADSEGINRLHELETLIAELERGHRRLCGGSGRYALSVPVAVDYFLIRCLAWAAETCQRRSAKSMKARIAGVRTDYLIALSIYADDRYRSAFLAGGFSRPELERLSELIDYSADIAGN